MANESNCYSAGVSHGRSEQTSFTTGSLYRALTDSRLKTAHPSHNAFNILRARRHTGYAVFLLVQSLRPVYHLTGHIGLPMDCL